MGILEGFIHDNEAEENTPSTYAPNPEDVIENFDAEGADHLAEALQDTDSEPKGELIDGGTRRAVKGIVREERYRDAA